jgi:hypothetical protein
MNQSARVTNQELDYYLVYRGRGTHEAAQLIAQ